MFSKKSFGLIFVSLIFLSVFASLFVGLVSAQGFWENLFGAGKPASGVFDPVKNMFSSWESGQLSVNVAKYLFWILVTLFVYSILAFVPVIKKLHGGAKFFLALIVGFLSTAYITPSDVYTSLAGYSALGLVLSAILPLVILLFFSIEIQKGGGVGGRLVANFMWFIFVVFLVWKLMDGVFGITTTDNAKLISPWEGFAYVGIIIFALIWVWFGQKQFLKTLYKQEGKVYVSDTYANTIASLEGKLAMKHDELISIKGRTTDAENSRNRIQVEIDDIVKLIEKYKKKIAGV